jgi:hypothetical protein
MTSEDADSKPRPMARNEELIRLAKRISKGESGKAETPFLSWKARPMRRRTTWEMLEMRRWSKNYGAVSF